MQTNDESNEQNAPDQSDLETSPHKAKGPKNPDELPDGSGTDAQSSNSEHGQEDGDKSFDAG